MTKKPAPKWANPELPHRKTKAGVIRGALQARKRRTLGK